MTDNTQPEALRLAEILEGDYCPDWFYEQGVDEVAAELRRQHTRIAELESELEAVGAGGVSGPLVGRASLSANAGEPVYQARYQKGFWQDSSRERCEYLQNPENTCAEDWETRILYTRPPTSAEGVEHG